MSNLVFNLALVEKRLHPMQRTRVRSLALGWYCCLVLSLPALYLAAAATLVPSDWALRHTRNSYQANMGYADRLHGAKCDVLIYGDSSAMVGVDPAVIAAQSGLTACNISEIEGVTTVMGTEMVDGFLRNNPRPKFLVFVFAPDDLNPQQGWTGPSRMEAVIYLMRTRRSLRMLGTLLQHPTDSFGALEAGLRVLGRDLQKPPLLATDLRLRQDHGGWYPYPKIAAMRCPPFAPPTAPDKRWVQGLRAKYESAETRVLVLTVPVPECDPYAAQHAREVAGVTDGPLEFYPLDQFSGADVGLHLIQPGAARFSAEIARRIQP